jgi:hypothetical protein
MRLDREFPCLLIMWVVTPFARRLLADPRLNANNEKKKGG